MIQLSTKIHSNSSTSDKILIEIDAIDSIYAIDFFFFFDFFSQSILLLVREAIQKTTTTTTNTTTTTTIIIKASISMQVDEMQQ